MGGIYHGTREPRVVRFCRPNDAPADGNRFVSRESERCRQSPRAKSKALIFHFSLGLPPSQSQTISHLGNPLFDFELLLLLLRLLAAARVNEKPHEREREWRACLACLQR